jgi:ribosomal protein S18 acetylase RimI-like enzyme
MKIQVQIREAEERDAPALVEFNLRMAMETEDKPLDPAVVAAGVRGVLEDRARGFYLVAESDGMTVGSLLVTTEWSDWRNGVYWWIQSVYVEPPFRRRGVYRALHEEVRTRARNTPGVRGCRLYVERDNETAQAAYLRLGMAETRYRIFEEPLA